MTVNDTTTVVGTAAGAGFAVVKSIIDVNAAGDTVILAAIGAVTGFIVTKILKLIENKIKQYKQNGKSKQYPENSTKF